MEGWGGSSVVECVLISKYKVLGSIPVPNTTTKTKQNKKKKSKSFKIKSILPPPRKKESYLQKKSNNLRKAIVLVSLFTSIKSRIHI